jgi:hypothetical protein
MQGTFFNSLARQAIKHTKLLSRSSSHSIKVYHPILLQHTNLSDDKSKLSSEQISRKALNSVGIKLLRHSTPAVKISNLTQPIKYTIDIPNTPEFIVISNKYYCNYYYRGIPFLNFHADMPYNEDANWLNLDSLQLAKSRTDYDRKMFLAYNFEYRLRYELYHLALFLSPSYNNLSDQAIYVLKVLRLLRNENVELHDYLVKNNKIYNSLYKAIPHWQKNSLKFSLNLITDNEAQSIHLNRFPYLKLYTPCGSSFDALARAELLTKAKILYLYDNLRGIVLTKKLDLQELISTLHNLGCETSMIFPPQTHEGQQKILLKLPESKYPPDIPLSNAELRSSQAELRSSRAELRSSRAELRSSRAELRSSRAELTSSRALCAGSMDPADKPRDDVSCGRDDVSSGRDDVSSGRDDVSCGRDDVSCGRDDVSCGRDDVSSGRDDGYNKLSIVYQESGNTNYVSVLYDGACFIYIELDQHKNIIAENYIPQALELMLNVETEESSPSP